jgi:hypothetical protein
MGLGYLEFRYAFGSPVNFAQLILVGIVSLTAAGTAAKGQDLSPEATKETEAKITMDGRELTTAGIAQERDLKRYDVGGHFDCRSHALSDTAPRNCDIPGVRDFIWKHWHAKRRGYIRITFDSVDAMSTSHIFVEPNQRGKWHVAWRIARHNNLITDVGEIVAVERAKPGTSDEPGSYVLVFRQKSGGEIERL